MTLNRRSFLTRSAQMAGITLAGRLGLSFSALTANACWPKNQGNLLKDPHRILDLAPGYRYKILQRAGDIMNDGYKVPALPDGMGCFFQDPKSSSIVLMRNHELFHGLFPLAAYPQGEHPPQAFDPSAPGGVTRVEVNLDTLEITHSNLALAGTLSNCAGGHSPWGWLSCEENIAAGHGFVFLCDSSSRSLQDPRPLKNYGRFNHEAALVVEKTHIAYLTEDREDSCFYRFVPHSPLRPFEGQLQALKVVGHPNYKSATIMQVNEKLAVEWVDLKEEDLASPADDLRYKAQALGAAIFKRGEGLCAHAGDIYFCCTTGGKAQRGQIFRYSPTDQLTLVAESTSQETLDMPDNITLSARGDIFMAEDGEHAHIRVITAEGKLLTLAKNAASPGEFTGLCFSPKGDVLFANMQIEGLTLAISGPFSNLGQ